ncbi:MAG: hypothetical protein LBO81_05525 [Clostridiales Family XIII bacterium]|nr:hypothetical protein [Clostridiales Family XIII bacterium]
MKKITKINPPAMPVPTRAFSNGIFIPLGGADLLFLSGQTAQDDGGNVMFPDDCTEQTRYVFRKIGDILKEADMNFDDVVNVRIFVTDMDESPKVSAVRDEAFAHSRPATSMIEISRLVKPDCRVEIEVVAIKLRETGA